MNNPATRVVALLETIDKTISEKKPSTYLGCFTNHFGKMPIHEIFLKLHWIDKELDICQSRTPDNKHYSNPIGEVRNILAANCIVGEARSVQPTTMTTFIGIADFAFNDESHQQNDAFEKIFEAVEELKASLSTVEDDIVRLEIENIATDIVISVENTKKYGMAALGNKPQEILGRFFLVATTIKDNKIRQRLFRIIEMLFSMTEKANALASLFENVKKLIGS